MGHRRFARHGSVPQIRRARADTSPMPRSAEALEDAVRRDHTMRAARQQAPQLVAAASQHVDAWVVSLDGLQPEKGHDTLDVVRELHAKRLWLAEARLSRQADAVRRRLMQARAWATPVGLPVHRWLSDTHAAFVTGIAAAWPGVPHRYGVHHVLRDLAQPMREAERHAKVKRRRQVRGWRAIEREVWQRRRPSAPAAPAVAPAAPTPPAASPAVAPAAPTPVSRVPGQQVPKDRPAAPAPPAEASEVVLASWSAVRGLRHADQGGPFQPPG
jgi:hypothetical protein